MSGEEGLAPKRLASLTEGGGRRLKSIKRDDDNDSSSSSMVDGDGQVIPVGIEIHIVGTPEQQAKRQQKLDYVASKFGLFIVENEQLNSDGSVKHKTVNLVAFFIEPDRQCKWEEIVGWWTHDQTRYTWNEGDTSDEMIHEHTDITYETWNDEDDEDNSNLDPSCVGKSRQYKFYRALKHLRIEPRSPITLDPINMSDLYDYGEIENVTDEPDEEGVSEQ